MSSVESSPHVRMMSPVVKAKARSQGAYNHQKSHSVIDQSPMNFSVKPKDIMNRQEASPIHQVIKNYALKVHAKNTGFFWNVSPYISSDQYFPTFNV